MLDPAIRVATVIILPDVSTSVILTLTVAFVSVTLYVKLVAKSQPVANRYTGSREALTPRF